jgi:hypothetical protein
MVLLNEAAVFHAQRLVVLSSKQSCFFAHSTFLTPPPEVTWISLIDPSPVPFCHNDQSMTKERRPGRQSFLSRPQMTDRQCKTDQALTVRSAEFVTLSNG